jgi:hypothetical protein
MRTSDGASADDDTLVDEEDEEVEEDDDAAESQRVGARAARSSLGCSVSARNGSIKLRRGETQKKTRVMNEKSSSDKSK